MPKITFSTRKSFVEVTDFSPKQHRRSVEKIAKYFQREFSYDFLQYSSEEFEGAIVYLLTDISYIEKTEASRFFRLQTIGAICFRPRQYKENEKKIWTLDWVWLHPYDRRKGRIQKMWASLVGKFGQFYVSKPWSKPMESFLEKNNYSDVPL